MFSAKVKQSALAYKQDPDKQERHDGNDDDEGELGMIEFLIRIIVFPFAVPIFMAYIYFFARGTPVAAELDALDAEDSGSDTSSEADILTAYDKSKGLVKMVYKFVCCRPDNVSEVANSNVLSYDAFMQQQKAAKRKEPKMKLYDNLPPYEVVVDVSRTDRVQIDKDGVFVRNIFVPLSDLATLEQLLIEIETDALHKEKSEGIEFDEWDDRVSVEGDTKVVIQELLEQARKKQGIQNSDKPLSHSANLKKERSGRHSPASLLSVDSGSPEKQSTSGVSPTSGTPGSSKKKPRKVPHVEGTPLRERMNMDAILDKGASVVDGPSIQTVPTGLLKAMQ